MCCARIIFQGDLAWILVGSTQGKQWRIELLYRYKLAKTSRLTVLNIRKLYLNFAYFKLHVYFDWSKVSVLFWRVLSYHMVHCTITLILNTRLKFLIFKISRLDLPRTEHNSWLPTIVSTVETLLKTRDKSDTSLPLCTDFVTTESAVNFKCADVNVVLLPINDWESHGGFEALYQLSMKQNADVQMQ